MPPTYHEQLERDCATAYVAGLAGHFGPADALERFEGVTPSAKVWAFALRTQRLAAQPSLDTRERFGDIQLSEVVALSRHASPFAVRCAQTEAVRRAVLRGDSDALRQVQVDDPSPLARGWLCLAEGDHAAAFTAAEEASEQAAQERVADCRIEAAALKALALQPLDFPEAVQSARVASRMARTEGMPQLEYLANLVLAHMRRASGRPHLASRILGALAKVVPSGWRALLAWELLLAGDLLRARQLTAMPVPGDPPQVYATAFLQELLFAARDRSPERFARARESLVEFPHPFSGRRTESLAVCAALDPTFECDPLPRSLTAWRSGESDLLPKSLGGLTVDLAKGDVGLNAAYVVVSTGFRGPTRRVVTAGVSIFPNGTEVFTATKGGPGRTESTLAALALAGAQGITREELFLRVYGFAFKPETHAQLFKVLLHRARDKLANAGRVDFEGNRLWLVPKVDLAIPDPRAEHPLEDFLLRFFAQRGPGTAKGAAQGLGAPLRSVQAALRRLSDEGALDVLREGRNVAYRVEDTTFSEPTRITDLQPARRRRP